MKNFKLFKSGFGEKLKLLLIPIGLLMGSITMQVWADSSKDYMFAGQRLYISCSGWLDDGAIIKINLYGTNGDFSKYVMASDFDRSNSLLYIDIDGQYKGFQIIRLNPNNQAQQWNHTSIIWADQRSDENQNCITPGYKKDNDGESTISWGTHNYTLTQNKYVYFVNEATNWSQPHFRIGKTTYTNAFDMTREPGTANLWVYRKTDSDWSGYNAFTITDGGGWTEGNDVFNPNAITNRTIYWYENVSDDITIIAGSKGGTVTNPSPNTDWYNATKNDGLTTYTVSTSTSHCTVDMEKYDNDAGTSTTNLASGETVLPTQYIKVSTTPSPGYQFSSVSVSNSTTVTDASSGTPGVYYITGNSIVTATCSAENYTITLDNAGGSGATSHSVTYAAEVSNIASAPTKSNYVFCGYYTESGTKLFNADLSVVRGVGGYTNASGQWIKVGGETLYAHWEDQWAIKGEGGILGNWDTYMGLPNTGTNTFGKSIELQKGTTYTFKIISRNRLSGSDIWYGNSNGSGLITINRAASGSAKTLATGGGESDNITITPDVTGNYTFSVNNSDGVKLTITYPASHTITFGAGDINGSSSPITVSASPSFSSGDYVLDATSVTFSKGSTVAGYDWKGWYSNSDGTETCHSSTNGNWTSSSRSGNLTVYACYTYHQYDINYRDQGDEDYSGNNLASLPAKHEYNTATVLVSGTKDGYTFNGWYDNSECTGDPITSLGATDYTDDITLYAKWTALTYTGRLVEADGSTVNGSYEVTYNDTKITVTSEPSKTGYEVEGYYKEYTPKLDVQVAEEDGDLLASRTYTDAEHKWIYSSAPDLYIKWEGKQYTITLDRQGGTTGSTSFTVTMGHNDYSAITVPTRAGYEFKGYYTNDVTPVLVIQANGNKNTGTTYINGDGNWVHPNNITLYAHWDPVGLTTSGSGTDWNIASNWSPACVPTSEHDVTIAHAVSVSEAQVAKSVTIDGGSLTIASDGALEVAGAITNDDPSKLVVEDRGALIFNSTGTTQATVEMSLTPANWQMVAIPVGYVDVKDAFEGPSVYTYVWKYGESWERRGYYDGLSAFESVLITGCTGTTFSGALVSTADQSFTALYNESKESGDVTMYGNSWTAPIAVSGMNLTATTDGAVHVRTSSGWDGAVKIDYIPALQGYAVLAKSEAVDRTVRIPYSAVRSVPAANRNTALYAPKRTASNDLSDHITVYVTTNDMKTRIRLFENEQFSDEIDEGYEAIYMEGEGIAGELYAQAERKMNVLATNNLEGTVLGFVPGEATSYTISFEGDGRGYYLNDMLTQQSTLIAEGNTYLFNPDAATNATRFVISRTPLSGSTATGVDQLNDGTTARKQMINGVLYIIREGKIYEATGKLVK